MAAYQDLSNLRTDSSLLSRFLVAVEMAAMQIVHEDAATDQHAARLTWAIKAVLQDDPKSRQYAATILRIAVMENGALQASGQAATDGDVQFIVNSYITTLVTAGV
jgi:hypothetical protein